MIRSNAMKPVQFILFLGLVILVADQAEAGSTYDAVSDFTISANPNGQWSYLYDPGSGPQLLTHARHDVLAQGVDSRWDGLFTPDSVNTFKNTTASTISFATIVLPTNLLGMDPQIQKSDITRWIAPSAGTWSISGLFRGIDLFENNHTVEVLENSTTMLLGPTSISSYGQTVTFSDSVSLGKGDTIDFIVNGATNYNNLSTGLSATIQSSVPEPSSLVLGFIASVACGSLLFAGRPRS